jgi:tetratricopeptide (TPR) repeat protein
LAYLALGDAYLEIGNRAASFEAIKKAKAYSGRATEKERLYIDAQYASRIERDANKRFLILKKLVDKYPKEKDAHYELGFYYRDRGMYKETALEYQKALELDPDYGPALNMLAYTYSDLGDYAKAVETFEKYAVANPEDANPVDSMAEQYFRMGDLDTAIAKYNEALEIQPNFGCESRLAYIYALKQEYAETMRLIEGFTARAPSAGLKAEGYIWMAMYDYLAGKRDKAFEDLRQAEVWSDKAGNELRKSFSYAISGWIYFELGGPERFEDLAQRAFDIIFVLFPDSENMKATYNHYLGLVDLKRGKIESAKARLKKIESVVAFLSDEGALLGKTESQVTYDWLHAEILIAEGSPDQAIEIFENIVYPPVPNLQLESIGPDNWPFIKDTLPRAYLKKGDIDGAIAEYERMIVFDPKGQDRRLIHPKYRYLLGKLYEEKGEVAKAIEQYEAFLELWKDADPGLPELEDAKKRLASLQSN